jgi:hypothetical protein
MLLSVHLYSKYRKKCPPRKDIHCSTHLTLEWHKCFSASNWNLNRFLHKNALDTPAKVYQPLDIYSELRFLLVGIGWTRVLTEANRIGINTQSFDVNCPNEHIWILWGHLEPRVCQEIIIFLGNKAACASHSVLMPSKWAWARLVTKSQGIQ